MGGNQGRTKLGQKAPTNQSNLLSPKPRNSPQAGGESPDRNVGYHPVYGVAFHQGGLLDTAWKVKFPVGTARLKADERQFPAHKKWRLEPGKLVLRSIFLKPSPLGSKAKRQARSSSRQEVAYHQSPSSKGKPWGPTPCHPPGTEAFAVGLRCDRTRRFLQTSEWTSVEAIKKPGL